MLTIEKKNTTTNPTTSETSCTMIIILIALIITVCNQNCRIKQLEKYVHLQYEKEQLIKEKEALELKQKLANINTHQIQGEQQ